MNNKNSNSKNNSSLKTSNSSSVNNNNKASNNSNNNTNNSNNNSNNNTNNSNNNTNNSNNNTNNSNNNTNNSNNNTNNNSNNNENNTNNNTSSKNKENNRNNINNFLNKHKNNLSSAHSGFLFLSSSIMNTPIQIKILNIVIMTVLTYVFTSVYYNLALSIIFGILTALVYAILGKYYGLIFLVLYIVYVIQISSKRNIVFLNAIADTDINYGGPLDCSLLTSSKTLPPSYYKSNLNNSSFSYSMWLYVNNNNTKYKNNWTNYKYNDWKSILYAGDSEIESSDISNLNQYPGFWMTPQSNNIVVTFQEGSNNNRIEIMNFPMNKWFNLTCVVERNSVSIYINCKLENNFALQGAPPATSEYNLYIANDKKLTSSEKNGFPGLLGNLVYYDYALQQNQINMICKNFGKKFEALQEKDNQGQCKSSCLITDSNVQNI